MPDKSLPIKGCIFDLDGVVVDTSPYHYAAWRRVANQFDFDFPECRHRELHGLSRAASLEKILEWSGIYLSEAERMHWADVKNNWYLALVADMQPAEVLPGVLDFLGQLERLSIPTALVSSSRNARAVLRSTRLEAFFKEVIDGNISKKAKPDPERYLLAARALGLKPAECVVFEDAPAGVAAAVSAGFLTVGVGCPGYLKGAQRFIPGFAGLLWQDLATAPAQPLFIPQPV